MATAPNNNNVSFILPAKRVPGPKQGEWEYNDYANLPDDGRRYEVMNGVLIMIPAPSGAHQDAVARFGHYFLQYVEFAGLGKMRLALFDVELTPKRVVQPDVLIILNANMPNLTPSRLSVLPI